MVKPLKTPYIYSVTQQKIRDERGAGKLDYMLPHQDDNSIRICCSCGTSNGEYFLKKGTDYNVCNPCFNDAIKNHCPHCGGDL